MMMHLLSRRATSRLIGGVALALLGSAAVQAQEAPQAPGVPGTPDTAPGAGGRQRGQGGGRGQWQQPAVAAFKATSPTPEQQVKFDVLQTKMREDMMALRGQGGQGGDAREKMQTMTTKFQDDVEAILTPAQQKIFKLEMAKATGNLNGQMEALDLTAEQQKQVRPLIRDTMDEMRKLRTDDTLTPETRPAKVEALLKDLKAKVRPILTPEQQTKLDAMELKAAPARSGRGGRRQGGQDAPPPAPDPAR